MPSQPTAEEKFKAFLQGLIRVPKAEVDKIEADRPKKHGAKRKKPAA